MIKLINAFKELREVEIILSQEDDEDLPGLPAWDGEYDAEKFYYWDKNGIPTDEKGKWVRRERVFTLGGHDVRRETYYPA